MIDPKLLGYYKKENPRKRTGVSPRQKSREAAWQRQGIEMDWAKYQKLLESQGGRCAVCRQEPSKTALAVDHDHDTGLVRGLLCSRCNYFLWRRNDGMLQKIGLYLARHLVKRHRRALKDGDSF